jgi:hypothetical protein
MSMPIRTGPDSFAETSDFRTDRNCLATSDARTVLQDMMIANLTEVG